MMYCVVKCLVKKSLDDDGHKWKRKNYFYTVMSGKGGAHYLKK